MFKSDSCLHRTDKQACIPYAALCVSWCRGLYSTVSTQCASEWLARQSLCSAACAVCVSLSMLLLP